MQNNLKKIMSDKGVTQQDVADALGVSRPTISNWIRSDNLPAKTAMALCAFLKVPLNELYGTSEQTESGTVIRVSGIEPPRAGFVRIPVFDVQGACGSGATNEVELVTGFVDVAAWFVKSLPGVTCSKHLQIISSTGDSMEPTITNRSLVIIDTNQTALRSDGVYCLRVDDELYIKRIQRDIDGTLTMLSDNPLYQPRTIKRSDLPQTAIIGRVVYVFNGRGV